MATCDWRCLPLPVIVLVAVTVASVTVAAMHAGTRVDPGTGCPAGAPPAHLNFTLRDLDGKPFRFASLAGHAALIDFWATWCAPCRVEMPALVSLDARDRPRGLAIVGVLVQDDFSKARPFAAARHVTYPVVDGTDRDDLTTAFGVHSELPTTVLISGDGLVCRIHRGLPPLPAGAADVTVATRETLIAEVEPLLRRPGR